ncbi:AGAP003695-PA-like protein [Anopheles sinensis]|uniref:AGAP003695-PA-like protein n=1 Tax=Anopheles sinensis TaxID=74873 RepID=A0A084WR46_ANOSI|nr:AGAP003695-PA-like protein [Anopheles sinensis]
MNDAVRSTALKALSQAEQNLHWLDGHAPGIAKWLVEQQFGDDVPGDNGASSPM